MQEEYGIKLKVITRGLKDGIAESKTVVKDFVDSTKSMLNQELEARGIEKGIENIKDKINKLHEKATTERVGLKEGFILDNNLTEKELDYLERLTESLGKLQKKQLEMQLAGKEITSELSNVDDTKITTRSELMKRFTDNIKKGWEEAKQSLKQYKDDLKSIEFHLSSTNTKNNVVVKNITSGFNKGVRAVKNFAFALFTVRGVYGVVRRAVSAYRSQDKELATQMNKTWASLGALVAPIIEKIAKLVRTAAAYVNYFVKALTGQDLIAQAVKKINAYNKSLDATSKAAKNAKKELTPLDEVTNLSFDDDEIEDAAEAFDSFSDIPLNKNITDVLDKWAKSIKDMWKFLEPVRNAIKNIIDWAVAHPDTVLKILGGMAVLKLIGGLIGVNGISALIPLLKGLAAVGVVVAGVDLIYKAATGRDLINDLKEIIDGLKELNELREKNSASAKESGENAEKLVSYYTTLSKNYDKNKDKIEELNGKYIDSNKLTQTRLDTIVDENNMIKKSQKARKDANKQAVTDSKNLIKAEKTKTDAMYSNWKQGKMSEEQTYNLSGAMYDQIKKYQQMAKDTKYNTDLQDVFKERARQLQAQLSDMTKKDYNAKLAVEDKSSGVLEKVQKNISTITGKNHKTTIEVETKDGENKTNALKEKLKELAKKWNINLDVGATTKNAWDALSKFFNPVNELFKAFGNNSIVKSLTKSTLTTLLNKIPKFDVGTNYVPNDQLAMVHKGEMIVPARYNPATSGIGANEETNALLYELNRNILELSKKPTKLIINGKELAETTYGDFENEGNRLNTSKTISIS